MNRFRVFNRNLIPISRHRSFASQPANQENEVKWQNASPYGKIPGPSIWAMMTQFLPGGDFHGLQFDELIRLWRDRYGDLVKLPGLFGRNDLLVTYNPKTFEQILRTEGTMPIRNSLHTIRYYRSNYRQDIYGKTRGIGTENGERWLDLRTKVNPILMQPKAVKSYITKTDQIAKEFADVIREIRNPETLEMPNTFGKNLKRWALETTGSIALDERLNALKGDTEDSRRLLELMDEFFALSCYYEMSPPFWKYYKSKKFYRLMEVSDQVTDLAKRHIDEKIKLLELNKQSSNNSDRSVLEKFLEINREIAIVIAIDMLMGGTDTTSAVLTCCLYHLAKNPDKQEILRQEIMKILPERSSQLTKDSLNKVPYMRACFKEAIRMSPVAGGVSRSIGQDLIINGYQVPKSTDVLMPMVLLQKCDEYFPESAKFNPERWMRDGEGEKIDPFVYLPFGFGSRSCIGKRFAEMETFVALTRLLREFKVEYHYGQLKYKLSLIFNPDEDLKFKFIDLEK